MILRKCNLDIYQPTDAFEKQIQKTFHDVTHEWLTKEECQLIASAIASLKSFDDWLDNEHLFADRIGYFFAPEMTAIKTNMVFVTHPLFVRDIFENQEIPCTLFSPVVFVTTPLAQFLLAEYPIHIYINSEYVKRENRDKLFVDAGGLIVCKQNVKLPEECINKIKVVHKNPEEAQRIKDLILNIQKNTNLERYAAKNVAPGIFQIEEIDRELKSEMKVWDKMDHKSGVIESVLPGEKGEVTIEYEEGVQRKIPKNLFDHQFVVTSSIHGMNIETAIKQKIRESNVLMKLFKQFGVSEAKLDDLKIEIVDLEDRYAETDLNVMKLDKSLFENGDFFSRNFFVVSHEIIHWLYRQKESRSYFNDEEEVLGFISAIAYELGQGTDIRDIWEKIYPKVKWHFHKEEDAKDFFSKMMEKAKNAV